MPCAVFLCSGPSSHVVKVYERSLKVCATHASGRGYQWILAGAQIVRFRDGRPDLVIISGIREPVDVIDPFALWRFRKS